MLIFFYITLDVGDTLGGLLAAAASSWSNGSNSADISELHLLFTVRYVVGQDFSLERFGTLLGPLHDPASHLTTWLLRMYCRMTYVL